MWVPSAKKPLSPVVRRGGLGVPGVTVFAVLVAGIAAFIWPAGCSTGRGPRCRSRSGRCSRRRRARAPADLQECLVSAGGVISLGPAWRHRLRGAAGGCGPRSGRRRDLADRDRPRSMVSISADDAAPAWGAAATRPQPRRYLPGACQARLRATRRSARSLSGALGNGTARNVGQAAGRRLAWARADDLVRRLGM